MEMDPNEDFLNLKETVIPVNQQNRAEVEEEPDEFEDLSVEKLQEEAEPEERVLSEASAHGELPPWVRAQIKAFLGWMNSHLGKRNAKINSIQDICDGVSLCHLLEILEGKQIFGNACKQKTSSVHQHLENVHLVLDYFNENSQRQLVGITGHAIVRDKNMDLILGLIWQFILKYSITMEMGPAGSNRDDDEEDLIGLKTETVTQVLLGWVNEHTPEEVIVTNFTTSFSDGVVFAHLLDCLKPGCVNFEDFEELSDIEALQRSFDVAESELGIPQLLDADLVNSNPDAHSIMTYVTFFRQYLNVAHAGRMHMSSEVENRDQEIISLRFELEKTKQLLEQRTAELEEEKNMRLEVENDYDQLAEELDGVKEMLVEQQKMCEQLQEAAGDSRESEDLRIKTYKQQNEILIKKLESDLQRTQKDYALARKRLKNAQLAGLDLRKQVQEMESNERQREIELQLKLEEQRTQAELEKEKGEQKAHETLAKALRVKIDKVTDEKRDLEKKLKDMERQLKRSQQQREEVGMQAQVLNQKFQSIQHAQVAEVLFGGGTEEKGTQTDPPTRGKRTSSRKPVRKTWACSKCTLQNDESSVECEACGAPRSRRKMRREVSTPSSRAPSEQKTSSVKRPSATSTRSSEIDFVNGLDPVKCWNRQDKELLTKFKQKKNQITWSFIINGRVHRIVLEHSVTSGKRKIMVDGGVEYEAKQMLNQVANHNFFLDSLPVKVKIEKQGSWFGYNLLIKDEPYETLRMRALGLM